MTPSDIAGSYVLVPREFLRPLATFAKPTEASATVKRGDDLLKAMEECCEKAQRVRELEFRAAVHAQNGRDAIAVKLRFDAALVEKELDAALSRLTAARERK